MFRYLCVGGANLANISLYIFLCSDESLDNTTTALLLNFNFEISKRKFVILRVETFSSKVHW